MDGAASQKCSQAVAGTLLPETSLPRGSPPVGGIKVNFPVLAEPKFGVVF